MSSDRVEDLVERFFVERQSLRLNRGRRLLRVARKGVVDCPISILEEQARRVIRDHLTQQALCAAENDIKLQTDNAVFPEDFRQEVEHILEKHPEIPWDQAVALIFAGVGDATA